MTTALVIYRRHMFLDTTWYVQLDSSLPDNRWVYDVITVDVADNGSSRAVMSLWYSDSREECWTFSVPNRSGGKKYCMTLTKFSFRYCFIMLVFYPFYTSKTHIYRNPHKVVIKIFDLLSFNS